MANALKNPLSTPLPFSIFLMEAAAPENSLPNCQLPTKAFQHNRQV